MTEELQTFSREVKRELLELDPGRRHCRMAELAALAQYSSGVVTRKSKEEKNNETACFDMEMKTEKEFSAKKVFTLWKKMYSIIPVVCVSHQRGDHKYRYRLKASTGDISDWPFAGESEPVKGLWIMKSCCRRSCLRGTFLACGSVNHPQSSYHLELVQKNEAAARQTMTLMESFDLHPRMVTRRRGKTPPLYVVYIKEADQIGDFLRIVGASKSLLTFENIRVNKEVANRVNRNVNCDAANMQKTADASVRQAMDIAYLDEKIGLDHLPVLLKAAAQLRLQYPEASLAELGQMLDPPVGKSGMNHRFRKLTELAAHLREGKEIDND